MRVLLTGATGFIGAALAEALAARGHQVVRAGRGPDVDLRVDFAAVPPADWWQPRLAGIDAVVNAVGILREQHGQRFQALHTDAPAALFAACAAAGVPLVVQISALGADAAARSAYHRSKRAADDVLRSLPLRGLVVQPSLVYGPGGSSAALFNGLAAAPLLMLPDRGAMPVQPVHLRDVVDGVVRLLEAPPAAGTTFAFAGPQAVSLRDYLGRLREQLGLRSGLAALPLPRGLFLVGARLAGRLPGSMLDAETAEMLLRGNTADPNALAPLLPRALTPVDRFIPATDAQAARTAAMLAWCKPLLRLAIALVWLWTAVVSLGLYPVEQSLALLAQVGLHGGLATVALYGAAALDLALGLLTLWAPPAWCRAVWAGQLLLMGGYTVLITLFLPEYWLHPYGPLSKNLPMAAAIALLWALEPARPRRR